MEAKKSVSPPKWPLKALRFFLKKDYLEEIEGDMEEVFEDYLENHSVKRAKWFYLKEVCKVFRPNLVRALGGNHQLNYIGMLQHNLLITLRSFRRHRTSFLINLFGLTTGLTASLLIFLWVKDEYSVDRFHANNANLYHAMTHFELPSGVQTWEYTTGVLGESMKADFPEVKDAVRVGNKFFTPTGVIGHGELNLELTGLYASSNFFEVMSYPLILGDSKEVLQTKDDLVLSESLAIKLFGSPELSIGKTLEWEEHMFKKEFIVTGVYKDPPKHSSKQFEAVIHYDYLIEIDEWAGHWNGGYAETYLLLNDGVDIDSFNEKIADYHEEKASNLTRFTLFLVQYSDLYLHGEYKEGVLVGGRIDNVRLFTFVGIFTLIIACINFMNLSTAQSSYRMKEIGVKKVVGAKRYELVFQFLTESIMMAVLSFAVSIILVGVLLPEFNAITGKSIELTYDTQVINVLSIVIITGIFAGSYPALLLSGFKPIAVLKKNQSKRGLDQLIRKGLVIVQFTISIVFILGVIVVNRQIQFTQTKSLGYDRENIVTFELKGTDHNTVQPMLNELKNLPGVTSVANMAGAFLWGNDSQSGMSWKEGEDDDNHLFKSPKIGYNLLETLGIEVVQGRSFSEEFGDDHTKVMINESALKFMELENPIGFKLSKGEEYEKEIIGVVKDFQYGSMHQKIEPMILRFRKSGVEFVMKLQPGNEISTLGQVESIYSEILPKYDFEPRYLDDQYVALYDQENKVASIANYAGLIAIIISCLGLFGLAVFTAEKRTKEIGIRKILGASRSTIVSLLTGSFTKTVVLAIVLAMPLGYFLANNWLQNFAYSINLQWWFFAVAGLSCLAIALLTVGFQTLRASNINPAQCLRNE